MDKWTSLSVRHCNNPSNEISCTFVFLFNGLMSSKLDTSTILSIKVVVIFGLFLGIVGVVESFVLAKMCFITLPLICHQVFKLS